MNKILWLGLPVKTWVIVLIPTLLSGLLPYIAAEVINMRDDKNE